MSSRRSAAPVAVLAFALAVASAPAARAANATATPPEIVAAYGGLADMLLAGDKTEYELVRAILATTFGHAEAALAKARAGGADAKQATENLAALVAQLGNEGDASVAAIRKRLLEGGHHHHHTGDQADQEYDEGFVIVTKAAKKVFLDAGKAIGRLAGVTDRTALDAEWQKVTQQYKALFTGKPS
jgi:hypothetical protein